VIHGTLTGYQRHGCRCQQCREANTAYMREGRYAGYRRDLCACGGEKYARAKRCWACRVGKRAEVVR
jgi:hypothetical protein